jgi:hypothetical protein
MTEIKLEQINPPRFFESASQKRLRWEIARFIEQLQNLPKPEDSSWKQKTRNTLNKAIKALNNGESMRGWYLLHEAECASVFLLDEQDGSLENCAIRVLNEGEKKLDDWRKKSVKDLIGEKIDHNNKSAETTGKVKKLNASDVYEAKRILTEHQDNLHIKMDRAHFQLETLGIAALLVIPIWIILSFFLGQNTLLLMSAVFFGALGGTASGLISVNRRSTKDKIPDQLLNSWSVIIKPIFGAISALVVTMFLLSGLLQLGNLTDYLVYAFSFVAGFSERFFLRLVEKSSNENNQE